MSDENYTQSMYCDKLAWKMAWIYRARKPCLLSYPAAQNTRTFVSSIRENNVSEERRAIDHRRTDFHEIIQGKPVPGQTSTGAFFFFGSIEIIASQ